MGDGSDWERIGPTAAVGSGVRRLPTRAAGVPFWFVKAYRPRRAYGYFHQLWNIIAHSELAVPVMRSDVGDGAGGGLCR